MPLMNAIRPARWLGANITVFAVFLCSTPAFGGPTTYDISILLYQPHPWIGGAEAAGASQAGQSTLRAPVTLPAAKGDGTQTEAQGNRKGREPLGPYSIFVYGGVASREVFSRYWKFNTTDTQLLAVGANARLYRFSFGLEVEGELGIARRFGEDSLWEGWISAGVRWREFSWNDVVDTTVGLQILGFDYVSEIPPHEREHFENENARLMNFFSPEVTLALPEHPEVQLLLRLHHRSKLFGLYNEGGATFYSLGLRFQI